MPGRLELYRYRARALWQEYLKRRPYWWDFRDVKSKQHGNFHFHDDGLITLQKQGNLLLSLRGLERVYYLLAIQSVSEGRPENYYWREFNRNIQKMIDNRQTELEPLVEQLRLE
jgi:hypothetical protein